MDGSRLKYRFFPALYNTRSAITTSEINDIIQNIGIWLPTIP